MFGFRKLDVYQCAVMVLPLAYRLAERADAETKRQLKRAAFSINLNIAEGTGRCDDDQRQFYRIGGRHSNVQLSSTRCTLWSL